VGTVVTIAVWLYLRAQSDVRFALKSIDVAGAVHTPRAAIDQITKEYSGTNLFRLDISRLQRGLAKLPWVSRVEIEKKLPDTLRIRVVERLPIALVRSGERLQYVDEHGVAFAALSPSVGDPELPIIRHHHEWYNGSGYPDRLIGDEIPKLARILHVADAFEAMTAQRPYRMTPLTPEQALGELRKFAGIQFDPAVVDAFVRTSWVHGVSDPGQREQPRQIPLIANAANRMTQMTAAGPVSATSATAGPAGLAGPTVAAPFGASGASSGPAANPS